MTKKHFIALADTIRAYRDLFSDKAVEVLADFCASENSRFNRERFLNYIAGICGPNGGAVKPAPVALTVTKD